MNVLDLFSGIGGFSLGLERAGMRTIAFCEIDLYCQRVLMRHWPDVPVFGNIRNLTAEALADAARNVRSEQATSGTTGKRAWGCGQSIDVICGGFPCQDISVAGRGAGIEGERSGLWSEFARIIGEVRPRYVIVENVAAILGRGLLRVLGDLTALGYDAEWHAIPASHIGAPHRRDRVWIVGYADAVRCGRRPDDEGQALADGNRIAPPSLANTASDGWGAGRTGRSAGINPGLCDAAGDVAHSNGEGPSHIGESEPWGGIAGAGPRMGAELSGGGAHVSGADRARRQQQWWGQSIRAQLAAAECADWWLVEPDVGRVAHGVPARVDRLRALGNAIVPQIAEILGKAIMADRQ